jgi:hypothetical protein
MQYIPLPFRFSPIATIWLEELPRTITSMPRHNPVKGLLRIGKPKTAIVISGAGEQPSHSGLLQRMHKIDTARMFADALSGRRQTVFLTDQRPINNLRHQKELTSFVGPQQPV